MRTSSALIFLTIICSLTMVLSSCKKDNATTETTTNYNWLADDALAQKDFSDLEDISNEGMGQQAKFFKRDSLFLGHCATVTLDLVSNPIKLTADFGTVNCVCPDLKSRRGKVVATFTGAYSDSGTVITISPDNYYVNNNQVLGTETITNRGHNPAGHLHYGVIVDGTIIKANGGGTITWHYTGDREWIAGAGTLTWWDDEYLVSGGSYGTAVNGLSYTMTTTTALDIKLDCKWITAGVISVESVNYLPFTVDFGNGECDNVMTVTYNGKSFTINMP